MGAYTGSGTVSGGSESISVLADFIFNGTYYHVLQKTVRSVTRRSGVTLAVAKSVASYDNTANHIFWYIPSGGTRQEYVLFNCKGERQSVSYSKIGDSNLYELEVTNEHLYIRITDYSGSSQWLG